MTWDLLDRTNGRPNGFWCPPRFIPQYQTQTPEEQGNLETKFLQFANHVYLLAERDYDVKVSEEEGIVYLRLINPIAYLKQGAISVSSTGKNGTNADVTATTRVNMHKTKTAIYLTHDLEVIIDKQKFVVDKYSRASF